MTSGIYERTEKICQINSEARKKWWAKRTHEEKLKYTEASRKMGVKARANGVRAIKARQNSSIAQKNYIVGLTKEQKLKRMIPCIRAGNEANRKLYIKMTKEERLKRALPMINGSRKWWDQRNKKQRSEFMHPIIKASQRANPSSIEKIIWEVLDELNINYETQIPFANGKFIVDIYVPNKKLIIEVNGDYWHNLKERKRRDKMLKKFVNENDYKIIWLWESDIQKSSRQTLLKHISKLLTSC